MKQNFLQKTKDFLQNFTLPFQPVHTNKAPKPVGHYSQAFKARGWLFCSGQIPLDPHSSQIVGEDIETQTKQVFENIRALLSSQNMTFKNVVKSMVFLTDMKEFVQFNQVYESYFLKHKPARSCVEVSALPQSVRVEVEVIAFHPIRWK